MLPLFNRARTVKKNLTPEGFPSARGFPTSKKQKLYPRLNIYMCINALVLKIIYYFRKRGDI